MAKREGRTFSEAIERVLLDHGAYAPLKAIYRDFPKYRAPTGKTPLKTIQERVQRDPRFTRIGLGVYALTSKLGELPKAETPKTKEQQQRFEHTRFQGMLTELGNLEGYDTYTADPSKVFENKKLGTIATIRTMPAFTYPRLVSIARYVDVLWFNARQFPERAFEVEYSTNFRNSLVKFTELQDFNTKFYLVAPQSGKGKYQREIERAAFAAIAKRCIFWTFEQLQRLYQTRLALAETMKSMSDLTPEEQESS